MPSYAAHLLLVEALRTGTGHAEFSQFPEDGDGTVLSAAFTVRGREMTDMPGGRQEALKVVLEVEGEPRNTFWCIGGSVVKSDWQGGTSYATGNLPLVLGGLDPRVRSILSKALFPPRSP